MKYIIFTTPGGLGFAMLFSCPITHAEAARMAASEGFHPVSAGFHDPETGEVFGESSSLNLVPRKGDADFLRAMGRATAAAGRRQSLVTQEEAPDTRGDNAGNIAEDEDRFDESGAPINL